MVVDELGGASRDAEQYVREEAKFYGKHSKVMTKYQKRVNQAAEELVLANPSVLHDRKTLLQQCRIKVDTDGYVYKKGKSRSKRHHDSKGESETVQPKRPKSTEAMRNSRVEYLVDTVADINKQIVFKNLRIYQAKNSNQFTVCEKITEEIRKLKRTKFQMETELKSLHRKQQQSAWYRRKVQTSFSQQSNRISTCSSESSTPSLCHVHTGQW